MRRSKWDEDLYSRRDEKVAAIIIFESPSVDVNGAENVKVDVEYFPSTAGAFAYIKSYPIAEEEHIEIYKLGEKLWEVTGDGRI